MTIINDSCKTCEECGERTVFSSPMNGNLCWNCFHDQTVKMVSFGPRDVPITETVKVKYFDDFLDRLEYIQGKSDWVDLRCAKTMVLHTGEHYLVPLGVAIEIPAGYEALVVPRSSAFRHYGFIQTNSMGVIDESYCGDGDQWFLPIYATRETHIARNDRIAQFRIIKHQPTLIFEEVDFLEGHNRSGFGSTGKA